ncbi:26179_t:CDS:1, partial [Racocetra persica]
QAARAMTQLAETIRGEEEAEKSLIKIKLFRGDSTEDSIDWINEFEQATTANNWSAARKLAIAKTYMHDNAED